MKHREPETRAQKYIDDIFNGTGTITTQCQEMREIAFAMQALGLRAGDDLLDAIDEIRCQAQIIAKSIGGYVGDQAEGRLYQEPTPAHPIG